MGNSAGITIDSIFSIAASFTVPREFLANSPHKICYCSADTEVIDGNNCAKNQLNGFITTVEVNGFHSISFAFQFSTS